MALTIDEAIKHAEEVGNGCNECAAEHRQLAEWLRKYQKIEEIVENYGFDTSWICLKKIREVIEDGKDN